MNELTESEIAAMCSDDIGEFAMLEDDELWLVAKAAKCSGTRRTILPIGTGLSSMPDETFWERWAKAQETMRIYAVKLSRGNAELSEDLLSDCMVKAYRYRAGYDPSKGGFVTWLSQVMRSVAIDDHRRRRHSDVPLETVVHLPAIDNGDSIGSYRGVLSPELRLHLEARVELIRP